MKGKGGKYVLTEATPPSRLSIKAFIALFIELCEEIGDKEKEMLSHLRGEMELW